MSDLIERLRGTKWLNDPFPAVFWDLTREAADEIERLTARADANADHAKLANENRAFAAAALKASQARVAELEGALTEIEESGGMTLIGCCDHYGNCDCGSLGERAHEYGAYKAFNQSAQTARAALKGDT